MKDSQPKEYSKRAVRDALDRVTSQVVRASYMFAIPGARQRDHWDRALQHLDLAEIALADALAILTMLRTALYGPKD